MQEVIKNQSDDVMVFGIHDQNVRTLEKELNIDISFDQNSIVLLGEKENTSRAKEVIEALLSLQRNGETMDAARIVYAVHLSKIGQLQKLEEVLSTVVCTTHRQKKIKCKNLGQKIYTDHIKTHDLVFSVGPAGTGKTYLAVALAVNALKNREVERIVLTRPAVEAGEKLGFLPGDMTQKVDPYLRPLYDALFDMMGPEGYERLLEQGTIEVAPLAFMRGRTLNHAFIILDEAQNTTCEQMKMFLTRIGIGSKCVVTGDTTQIDLPRGKGSGLIQALQVLQNVPEVFITHLNENDVVRHELVKKIVSAYEKFDQEQKELKDIDE